MKLKLIWWLLDASCRHGIQSTASSESLSWILHCSHLISDTFFGGVPPLSHLPKFTPKQSLLLGSSRRGWEHFRFNAVQRVGLYTQHSPGTDLQELGQWCQCLENLQQPKFWRTFLCSRGFLEIIPETNISPSYFFCYICYVVWLLSNLAAV